MLSKSAQDVDGIKFFLQFLDPLMVKEMFAERLGNSQLSWFSTPYTAENMFDDITGIVPEQTSIDYISVQT